MDALAADAVNPDDVLAASGVTAFAVEDLARMLGTGAVVPVPHDAGRMASCWALHASDAPRDAANADAVWRAAYDAASDRSGSDLPPPATHAELAGTIADEALARFRDAFLS
jgi:hypothetical protein